MSIFNRPGSGVIVPKTDSRQRGDRAGCRQAPHPGDPTGDRQTAIPRSGLGSLALAIATLAAIAGPGRAVPDSPTAPLLDKRATFADWCRDRQQLDPAPRRTVDALLVALGELPDPGTGEASGDPAIAPDCDRAAARLETRVSLNLIERDLSDLRPLVGARNLQLLLLADNAIADLSPLAELRSLTTLSLRRNRVADLSPLAGLTDLLELDLTGNRIEDATPLAGLFELQRLYLSDNRIADPAPLASLRRLSMLAVADNQIADLSALAPLRGLVVLAAAGNPLRDRACPLRPARICQFE